MKITIETSDDYLQIENADTATATAAVRSFCTMLKAKASPRPETVKAVLTKKTEDKPATLPEAKVTQAVEEAKEIAKAVVKPTPQQSAKQTEFVRSTVGMENIRFTDAQPPVPLYLSKYDCPTCGHKGNRYSVETNKYLKCHECDSQLMLEKTRPMTEYMESDEDGYFFKASRIMSYHNNLGVRK